MSQVVHHFLVAWMPKRMAFVKAKKVDLFTDGIDLCVLLTESPVNINKSENINS